MKSEFKLGTRKSLLAWAQSEQIARDVERLNPGIHITLVGIETKGDQIQDIPLQKVEGKDFFVAELDQALLAGKVDFAVHCLKDLSLTRPDEVCSAAIPRRENPRDVALFGPGIFEKIRRGKKITIGTSSPRRLENAPGFLTEALPRISPEKDGKPQLEFVQIRGNVNTRLGRLHEPLTAPKHLDGVILAFAGIIRLWADEKGRAALRTLLQDVRWMVLPLHECPAAPGQGALAIECRSNDEELRKILAALHDDATARSVQVERELLAEWGGGCHLKLGGTQISGHPDLLFIRGRHPDGTYVEEIRWSKPPRPAASQNEIHVWDGSLHRFSQEVSENVPETGAQLTFDRKLTPRPGVFVAHARAVRPGQELDLQDCRIWTSGVSSWYQLAERGLWVEGCAEGLGFDLLTPTLGEKVLELPPLPEWTCLTHVDAQTEWQKKEIRVVPTYRLRAQDQEVERGALETGLHRATHLFWSSGSQYQLLKNWVPAHAQHACGPGKTFQFLQRLGLQPAVFPSAKEWRKWINLT